MLFVKVTEWDRELAFARWHQIHPPLKHTQHHNFILLIKRGLNTDREQGSVGCDDLRRVAPWPWGSTWSSVLPLYGMGWDDQTPWAIFARRSRWFHWSRSFYVLVTVVINEFTSFLFKLSLSACESRLRKKTLLAFMPDLHCSLFNLACSRPWAPVCGWPLCDLWPEGPVF